METDVRQSKDTIVIRRAHRSGNIGTSDALYRRIEVVKGFTFNNLGADLVTYTEGGETTLDGDQPLVSQYLHACDGNH